MSRFPFTKTPLRRFATASVIGGTVGLISFITHLILMHNDSGYSNAGIVEKIVTVPMAAFCALAILFLVVCGLYALIAWIVKGSVS